MNKIEIRRIRAMIRDGYSDDEIAQADAESAEAWADYEAMQDSEPTDGPAYLHCDGYYQRNDAGEWMGLM